MNTIKFPVTSNLRRTVNELDYVSNRWQSRRVPIFNTIHIFQSHYALKMTRINAEQRMVFSYHSLIKNDGDFIIDYNFFRSIVDKTDSESLITLNEVGKDQCSIVYSVNGEWLEAYTQLFDSGEFYYDQFSSLYYEDIGSVLVPIEFRDAVYTCETAASTDEERWVLNSVYFHQKKRGSMCLVGTDGKRLNLSPDFKVNFDRSFILPTKAVPNTFSFKKKPWYITLLSNIKNSDDTLAISITAGDIQITTKTIDGNYPTYWKVFPKRRTKWNTIIKLNDETRDSFIAGLKSIPVANRKKPYVILNITPGAGIILQSEDEQTQIPLDIPAEGGELLYAVDRNFMIDLLRVGHTRLHFTDAESALYATAPSGFTSLLMPVRLNKIL
jgi:hypothetical protein